MSSAASHTAAAAVHNNDSSSVATATTDTRSASSQQRRHGQQQQQQRGDEGGNFNATVVVAEGTTKCYDTVHNIMGTAVTAHMNTNVLLHRENNNNRTTTTTTVIHNDDAKNQQQWQVLPSSSPPVPPPPPTQSSLSSFNDISSSSTVCNDVFPVSHVPHCDTTAAAAVSSSQSHYYQHHHLPPSYRNPTTPTLSNDKNSTADHHHFSFNQQQQQQQQQQSRLNNNDSSWAKPDQIDNNKRRSSLLQSYWNTASSCCNNSIQPTTAQNDRFPASDTTITNQKSVAAEHLQKASAATSAENFANRLLQTGSKRATSILNFLSTRTAAVAASSALLVSSSAAHEQQPSVPGPVTVASSSTVHADKQRQPFYGRQHNQSSTLSSTPSSPTTHRRTRTGSSANVTVVGNICRRAVESVTEKLYSAYLQQQQQTGEANAKRTDAKQLNVTDAGPVQSLPMHSNNGESVLLPNTSSYHGGALNLDYLQTTLGMSTSPTLPRTVEGAVAASTTGVEDVPGLPPSMTGSFSSSPHQTSAISSSTYHAITSLSTSSSSSPSSSSSVLPAVRPVLHKQSTVMEQQRQQQQLSSTSSLHYPGSAQFTTTASASGTSAGALVVTSTTHATASTISTRRAVVGLAPSPAVSSRTLPLSPNNSVDKPYIASSQATQHKHGRTDSYDDDDDTGDGLSQDRKSKHYTTEASSILMSLGTSISAMMSTTNANSSANVANAGSAGRRHQHFLTISAFPSPPSSKVPSQSDFYQTLHAAGNTNSGLLLPGGSDAPLHLSSSLSYNDSFRSSSYHDSGNSQHQPPNQGPPTMTVAAPAGVIIVPSNINLPTITGAGGIDDRDEGMQTDSRGLAAAGITSSSSASNISSVINSTSHNFAPHRAVVATYSTPPAFVVADASGDTSSDKSSHQSQPQTQSTEGSSSSVNNLRLLGIGCAGSTVGPPGSRTGMLSPKLALARGSLNVTSPSKTANILNPNSPGSSPASRRRASAIAQNMMVLQASGAALVRSKLLASAVAGQPVPINSQQQTLYNYKPSSAMTDISTTSVPTAKTAAEVNASSAAAAKQAADEQANALQRPKPLPLAVSASRAMSSASQTAVVKSNSIDVTRRGMRFALHHQSFVKHGDDAARVARDARDRAKDQEQKIPHLKALQASDDNTYRQLGTYKVGNATLGHGTYSIVKLAYNDEDQNHYAMKILSKKKLTKKFRMQRKTGDPLQDVRREIAILRKVNHPNIIKLMEVLDDPSEDYLYLVFELLEREVIEVPTQNPLSEDEAWAYFREVVRGVEYLHHYRIVHRDLKPSNLLLSESGELKIADFGLSDEFEGVDASLSGTVGTPAFTAPECLDPAIKSYSGRAIDIWCMGITLYCFVAGDVPFKDDFLLMLYNKIRHNQPEFPATLSDNLKDLILRMLEKNAEQRITLEQIKHHPWVTKGDLFPMLTEDENCNPAIFISNYDIETSVKTIPSLSTLILVKHMIKRASFSHPFRSASTCT